MSKIFSLLFPPKTPVENFEQTLITLTESRHPLTDIYRAWIDPGVRPDWHNHCKSELANLDLEFYQAIDHFCDAWRDDNVEGNPLGILMENYRRFCAWKIKEEWLASAFPKLAISLRTVEGWIDIVEESYNLDLTVPRPNFATETCHVMK